MKRIKRNWFSNFLPFDKKLEVNGIKYNTPEHFYQAMKTTLRSERKMIAAAKTPGQAKKLGRQVKIRSDWEEIKFLVMEYALRYKFGYGTSWHKRLMETKGPITEWNYWHDNIWGDCLCDNCIHITGKNHLGKLLMKLRKEWS